MTANRGNLGRSFARWQTFDAHFLTRIALKLAAAGAQPGNYGPWARAQITDKRPEGHGRTAQGSELDPGQADCSTNAGDACTCDFAAAAARTRRQLGQTGNYAEAYYTLGTVLKQRRTSKRLQLLCGKRSNTSEFAGAHRTTPGTRLRQPRTLRGCRAESRADGNGTQKTTIRPRALFATTAGRMLLNAGDLDGAISPHFRAAISYSSRYGAGAAHFELDGFGATGNPRRRKKNFERPTELDLP